MAALPKAELCKGLTRGEGKRGCGAVRILTLSSRRHELRADFFGVLAERRHRAVAARFALAQTCRRRIADRPVRRLDPDAPQVRMFSELGHVAHPAEGDCGGDELLDQALDVDRRERGCDAAVGLAAPLPPCAVGGE